jgi:carbon starvation protein
MNSLVFGLIAICLLCLGYKFYARIIERLWEVDPQRKTPAIKQSDGVDYIPAKHWTILFSHHFSSIAGAGPIIGPVVAVVCWGWAPALLWIVLGSILLGGVHDFSALMVSVRHKGRSIGDVAESVINYRVKLLFTSFLWLSLILVVAVFAAVGGKTLAVKPQIVIPTFGLILVALLVGVMIYRLRIKQTVSTLVGLVLFSGLIVLGYYYPISIGGNATRNWTLILLAYAFVASVLPVNILLQPRDYLAGFVLFFGLFFGYLGLAITHPTIHTPVYLGWKGAEGHIWPMLCVLIACGAISGFHSMVASGTTSKQLASELDAKRIGYGGMVTEGALATLAVLCVSAGLYFTSQQGPANLVYPTLVREKGWIVAFGAGYGELVKPIFGTMGTLVAIMMVKAFVLTTLDSATRISRYFAEELFGEGLKIRALKNRYLASGVVIILAGYLALGNWQAIWPVFGASNQLVAALALLVVTTYLLSKGKPIGYTLYPCVFMFATTTVALVYEITQFIPQHKYLLATVGVVLLILAGFMLFESISVAKKRLLGTGILRETQARKVQG